VEAAALLYALAHTLAEMERENFGNRVADVEGIAGGIRQLMADILVDTLRDV